MMNELEKGTDLLHLLSTLAKDISIVGKFFVGL